MKHSWKSWIRAVAAAMATGSAISSASAQQYDGPSSRTVVTQTSDAARSRDTAGIHQRIEAIQMLGNHEWQNDPDVQEALVRILRRDPNENVRLVAAQMLTKAKTLTAKSHLALQCVLMGSNRDGGPIEQSGAVKMAVGQAMRNPHVTGVVSGIAANQNRRTITATWTPSDGSASTWNEPVYAPVSAPPREILIQQSEPVYAPPPQTFVPASTPPIEIRIQQPEPVYAPAPQSYIPVSPPPREIRVQQPGPVIGTLIE